MAKDKCIDLVAQALKRGNVNEEQAASIVDNIRKTQREAKLENLDSSLKDELANQVLKEQQISKKIKERNAIENEIKIRTAVESVLVDFKGNEATLTREIKNITGRFNALQTKMKTNPYPVLNYGVSNPNQKHRRLRLRNRLLPNSRVIIMFRQNRRISRINQL
jgi:polyhydroxyalkanoate synthesis regulator phasin